MSAKERWRGHRVYCKGSEYFYADTHQRVAENKDRACGHCGKENTMEGHDGCLGTLPGVMNACCGHGDTNAAYVQYEDSESSHETLEGKCRPCKKKVLFEWFERKSSNGRWTVKKWSCPSCKTVGYPPGWDDPHGRHREKDVD